jgi:hypothetical protein
MKICYIYANCFGKVLKDYLENISDFNYEIKVFYMMDCISTIDINKIKICDLFIYQHMTTNALTNKTKELCTNNFNTNEIVKLLPIYCVQISISSPYYSGYFVNGITQDKLKNVNKIDSKHYIYFPNYCFNSILLVMLINNKSTDEILQVLNNPKLYSKEFIINNAINSLNELKKREVTNNVDIRLSIYIESNFTEYRLFHTTNHPSKYIFNFVIGEIFKKINLSLPNILNEKDLMETNQKAPILQCIINTFNLNENEFGPPYYIQGNKVDTLLEYILFYKQFIK